MARFVSCVFGSICTRQLSTTKQLCVRHVKRRITRLQNDYEMYQEDIDNGKLGPNDVPAMRLVNRNPRNLEQLQYEQKPLGYELEASNKVYWNRVEFDRMGQFLEGRVVHFTGRTLVTASTREESLRNSGISRNDQEAAKILGFLLAQRCLESGILFVDVPNELNQRKSEKEGAFLQALKEHGLRLKEPEFFFPRRIRDL